MGRIREWLGEQWPIPYIPQSLVKSGSALRGVFSEAFRGIPTFFKTTVDHTLARALYRNDEPNYNLGSGFVRPIIDLSVEYIGLPKVTSDDPDTTTWLNDCIHDHWAPDILQVWRDSLRDSKTIMRFRQPSLENPLFTEDDRMHGKFEVLPPELVELSWSPTDPDFLDQAVVHHEINFDERTDQEVIEGWAPRFRIHHILEIISPDKYRFYDKTDEKELTTWNTPNSLKFVPLWPAYNEYAADLGGGQSDIEPVLPFIKAFHEVMLQSLTAHRYHSTPKAKFNLKDVGPFLANNFPEVLDPDTKKIKPGSKLNWSGREVLFFEAEEDGGFIEARSVLGDSKTLLEFLLDCIAIASEVPKWALLKESALDTDASVQPFEKKIGRKRIMFAPLVQIMCKMALVAKNAKPETVKVIWPALRLTDLASKAQSAQQIVMALDTAKMNRWISDDTCIEILSSLFDEINDPATEKEAAKNNYEPPIAAPAPQSDTQAAPSKNGNGGGNKSTAKKAVKKITTGAASNS